MFFFSRTHFDYDPPERGELSFDKSEVFHVVDTLHNGVVGSWQALRISGNKDKIHRGVVPNKARAEELATQQFNAAKKEQNAADQNKSSIFSRRRRDKAGRQRRSKSLGKVSPFLPFSSCNRCKTVLPTFVDIFGRKLATLQKAKSLTVFFSQ